MTFPSGEAVSIVPATNDGHASLAGGGDVGARIRAINWAATPLGGPETWPASLQTALSICLHSAFPTAIYWGPELRHFYNDAWIPIPGERHPWALGRPAGEVWGDIWSVIGPQLAEVLRTGEGFSTFDQLLPIKRNGRANETYWNYSFTPIQGDDGRVLGVFTQAHEVTDRVLGERRNLFLLDLSDRLRALSDPRAIIDTAQEALGLHLKANRVGYGEVEETARHFTTDSNWTDGTVPSRMGTHDLAGFGPEVLAALRAGVPLLIPDVANDPRTNSPESLAAFDAIDTRAVITASLVKDGRMRAALYVHAHEARPWTERDAELVTEVAERTWSAVERARAEADTRASEARLRESEARFRALFEQAPLMIHIFDPSGRTLMVNPTLTRTFGLPAEALRDYNIFDDPQMQEEGARDLLVRMFRGQVVRTPPLRHDAAISTGEGVARWVETLGFPVKDDAGALREVVLMTQDITAAHEAQVALRRSEERFRTALEIETVGAIYFDLEGRLTDANDAFLRASGYNREDLEAGWLTVQGLSPPEMQGEVERTLAELKVKGETTPGEREYIRPDGSRWWALCAAKVLPDGSAFKFVLDITDRKAVEAALLEETRRLETLNRTGAAVAGELDLEPLIQLITDAGVDLTGARFGSYFHNEMDETGERLHLFTLSGAEREEFLRMGRPRATGVFGPTFRNEGVIRSDDILADPRYGQFEPHRGMPKGHLPVRSYLAVSVVSRSGEVLGGLIFGHPEPGRFTEQHERLVVGLAAQAAIAIDNARLFQAVQSANETLEQRVAERTVELTQAHEALRQAQKMEAVGQLTGGLAHDFNNLLAGISGSLEAIERRLAQGRLNDLDRFLKGAQSSSQRAAALTQRLLAFARRQTLDPKPTDVNRLVLGMEELIRRTVGPGIEVEVVGAEGLWSAKIDAVQLESALLNLAINARDAMPAGGRLTIETANKWLDARAAKEREIPPGPYLSLCVTDTGTGMPKEIIERIFDPFFTTKPLGKGTGLGLSMVHGFVRQSGGQVRVYSEVDQGTTMCLYLPRHHGELAGDEAGQDPTISETGRGETVLVIDDEPTVRMLIVEVLEEAGYTALEAEDGPSGLRILQSGAGVDLLITDVGLPGGMNGRQVADAARVTRPELKVLFVTGFAENAAVGNGHLEPGMEVMTKPFAMADLAHKISEMVEG